MATITPFLWFNNNAEEAVDYYTTVFKDSKIRNKSKSAGKVLLVDFELNGQKFIALNGGKEFQFNESISMYVHCDNQEEMDYYWEKLSADPKAEQCGWLKDKYGLSWQIVPSELGTLMNSGSPEKSKHVMEAVLKMKKLDLSLLKQAFDMENQ